MRKSILIYFNNRQEKIQELKKYWCVKKLRFGHISQAGIHFAFTWTSLSTSYANETRM